nr:TBC1 domain family member 15-like [Physcomitrium patens]|eukprot:XP_024370342.1 TBC1 domain family member 15-like [Physcomitrella patens]
MLGSCFKPPPKSTAEILLCVGLRFGPDALNSHISLHAWKTLSPGTWNRAFNEHGQLRLDNVLNRIRRGGVDPSIRAEVWEFLLGCFGPSSTTQQRDSLRASRSGQIATSPRINADGSLAEECNGGEISGGNEISHHQNGHMNGAYQQTSIAPYEKQCKKTIQWRLNLHQIGLDVVRTDRMLQFYASQEHMSKLWDILAVYCWLDPAIGYCQGMSDFCSPLALMFQDEADAFWCFERIMSRLRDNFSCTDKEVGVEKQLAVLATLLKVLDPKLHEHIDSIKGGDYIFAFRMIMVLFRREFSFVDTLYLWEMDTLPWLQNYMPYGVGLGTRGLDEVLKLLNDVTGKVDPKEVCKSALKLHSEYLRRVRRPSK